MMPQDLNAPPTLKHGRAYVNLPDLQHFLNGVLDYIPSERTIIQWRQQGCPHLRISDRCLRYVPEDVLAWLVETRQVQKQPIHRAASLGGSSRKQHSPSSRTDIMAELQTVAAQGRR